MSAKTKWLRMFNIQFFADGASGGDGGDGGAASTGVTPADAGQETGVKTADAGRSLESLGVPRDKAERYRQRMEKKRGKTAPKPAANDGVDGVQTPQSPPQSAETAPPDGEPKKDADPWDTFFSDPKNQERLTRMMAERGRKATEQVEKLSPTLKLLGDKYGVKPNEDGSYDLDAINKAVTDDDSYFEEKAVEMGVSVDVAKKLAHADELDRQQQEAKEQAQRRAQMQEHFNKVQQQARALQEIFPDFNLEQAMQDPEFVRRTAPGGMPVKDAWYSLHGDEIIQRQANGIARRARQNAAAAVQSGSARPRENGSSATAAVSATPNMRAMSRDERIAYIKNKYPPRRI